MIAEGTTETAISFHTTVKSVEASTAKYGGCENVDVRTKRSGMDVPIYSEDDKSHEGPREIQYDRDLDAIDDKKAPSRGGTVLNLRISKKTK